MWPVALVGFFVVLAVIHYRNWHAVYSRCFTTLQDLRLLDHKLTAKDVTDSWDNRGKMFATGFRRQWKLLSPFGGTEAATFFALLVISYVPWFLIVRKIPCLIYIRVSSDILAFLINLVLYSVGFGLVAMLIFYRSSDKGPFHHWPLKPFDRTMP